MAEAAAGSAAREWLRTTGAGKVRHAPDLRISSPGRVVDPQSGITKIALVRYYAASRASLGAAMKKLGFKP